MLLSSLEANSKPERWRVSVKVAVARTKTYRRKKGKNAGQKVGTKQAEKKQTLVRNGKAAAPMQTPLLIKRNTKLPRVATDSRTSLLPTYTQPIGNGGSVVEVW